MAEFIASKVVKLMIKKEISISNANVLILGITFKENCPDVRNTKVVDVYKELEEYGLHVDMYDPWADRNEVEQKYKINMLENIDYNKKYDTIVLAVSHDEFLTLDLNSLRKETSVVFDIKAKLDRDIVDARL
jgi:UDP-N-acetyl-D-galactosamine dehydrogenase